MYTLKLFIKKLEMNYILITHNSDIDISDKEIANKDKKIIHWFAQNLVVKLRLIFHQFLLALKLKKTEIWEKKVV